MAEQGRQVARYEGLRFIMNSQLINSRQEAEEYLHSACERYIGYLSDLRSLHLEIDPPERIATISDPGCVFRLRKVCLHVGAIISWEISIDILHVMAPDIRAAGKQLNSIVLEFYEGDEGVEPNKIPRHWEENDKLLAGYSHPTAISLMLGRDVSGFGKADTILCLYKIYTLLAGLVCDYGIGVYMVSETLDPSKQPEIHRMIDRHGVKLSGFPSASLLRFVERTE